MHHTMVTKTSLPMQIQRIVEHFAVECSHRSDIGLVIMDRSSDRLDAHTSHCVASYKASNGLPLHPVVHNVDSVTSEPTQAAELTSSIRRRTIEGTPGMQVLDGQLAAMRPHHLSETSGPDKKGTPCVPGSRCQRYVGCIRLAPTSRTIRRLRW